MSNINDRYKCKVVITDRITGEEVIYNLDEFQSHMRNDLGSVPNRSGDLLPAPMYSLGCYFELTGYIINPNADEEIKKAIEEAESRGKG